MMIERDWYGCYGEGWTGLICPDAFAHPAKFARGLIRRIYEHAFDRGWFQTGDAITDPFAGVALGALHAMQRGLHWYGVELEEKFVGLGNDNIALWNDTYSAHMPNWGTATLLQGDSRELAAVLGRAVAGSVSSPPYAERDIAQLRHSHKDIGDDRGVTVRSHMTQDGYSANSANLGNLRASDADHAQAIAGVVSSPPYSHGTVHGQGGIDPEKFAEPERAGRTTQATTLDDYGRAPGQLGAMREGEISGAVSSPPWERGAEGILRKEKFTDPGRFAAAMSSADGRGTRHGTTPQSRLAQMERDSEKTYGISAGQLGQESGDTFWTAARTIMEQLHLTLAPGAHAIWVVKAFVRNKQRVDFPGQWRDLGEACGFETVEWIRAWLVENRGAQYMLNGDLDERKVERKSFFRRLAESKGSPPIDYEVVLVQRKPHTGD